MKKLLILFIIILNSCTTDKTNEPVTESKCYNIISRGDDERGNYIIINYSNFVQKRYSIANYQDYIGQSKLCEPINLIEQPL